MKAILRLGPDYDSNPKSILVELEGYATTPGHFVVRDCTNGQKLLAHVQKLTLVWEKLGDGTQPKPSA